MKTAIICGALRLAESLERWRSLLPGVQIFNLPGHGSEPIIEPSLASYTAHFEDRLRGFNLVIGESLGGTVALCLNTPAKVIAVDPPLSSAGALRAAHMLRDHADRWRSPDFDAFVLSFFGMRPDRSVEPRDYRPHLKRGSVLVATNGSLLTVEERRWLIDNGYSPRPVFGSHDLMTDNPEGVLLEVRNALQHVLEGHGAG